MDSPPTAPQARMKHLFAFLNMIVPILICLYVLYYCRSELNRLNSVVEKLVINSRGPPRQLTPPSLRKPEIQMLQPATAPMQQPVAMQPAPTQVIPSPPAMAQPAPPSLPPPPPTQEPTKPLYQEVQEQMQKAAAEAPKP